MQITRMQKRVCKDFEINDLGEYHDLHIQGDTLFLPDVFEIFDASWNIWTWSCKISFSSWIIMASIFKKD